MKKNIPELYGSLVFNNKAIWISILQMQSQLQ